MPDRVERVGDSLGKKVGPLPAGIWLGLLAVAAYFYQHRKGAGTDLPVVVPSGPSSYFSTVSNVNVTGPPPPPLPIRNKREDQGSRPPPVPVRWPPPAPGPGRPGGEGLGVPMPDVGAVAAVLRLPARALGLVRRNGGGSLSGAVAGQRATARRPSLRPALRAAQRATEDVPGLVGLDALKEAPAERERSEMPPAPALRQRPAPPRVTDPETQRNVKHEVFARG